MVSFNDALNDSINRINNGQSVADCLRHYPEHADQLRGYLLTGQTIKRAEADAQEVASVRANVWREIEQELDNWSDPPNVIRPRFIWILVALFFVTSTVTSLFLASQSRGPVISDEVAITQAPTITPSPTQTATTQPTQTLTTSPTQTASPMQTATTQPTQTASPAPTMTQTSVPDQDVVEAPQNISEFESNGQNQGEPALRATDQNENVPEVEPEDETDTALLSEEALSKATVIYPSLAVLERVYDVEEDFWEIVFENDRLVVLDATTENVIFFGFETQWENRPDELSASAPSDNVGPDEAQNMPGAPPAQGQQPPGAASTSGQNDNDDDDQNGNDSDDSDQNDNDSDEDNDDEEDYEDEDDDDEEEEEDDD